MYDTELGKWSELKLLMSDGDTSVLTQDERDNLLDMIDSYIISQGWDLKDFMED